MAGKTCSIDKCDRNTQARGWCEKHYHRWTRHGSPHVSLISRSEDKRICIIEDCNNMYYGRGWCNKHYLRWMNHGDPLVILIDRCPGPKDGLCSREDCTRKHYGVGFCYTHYVSNKMKTDINFRLAKRLRGRMQDLIRAGSAVRDLGCSVSDFKEFIEQRFSGGMSWPNYGKWHLDHIVPLASFDLTDRQQFLEAAHYSNYQPLWAQDNLSKGAKVGV